MGKHADPFLEKLKAKRLQRTSNVARDRIRKWTDPVLSQWCRPVTVGENVRTIAADMLETLQAIGNGVGLAAPQIGHVVRIIVIAEPKTLPVVMVNPEMTVAGEMVKGQEGCLSYPDIYCDIMRYSEVTVTWFDVEDVEQKTPIHRTFTGFAARIVQHEVDHLNGVCRVGDQWRKQKPKTRECAMVLRMAARIA